MGEHRYQLLGESVSEILVVRVGTDIVEREDRQPFPPALRALRGFVPWHGDLEDLNRRADVPQRPTPEAEKRKVDLVLHVVVDLAREADPPIFCEGLDPGCDVASVA